ncbi:hypothetical protein ANN_11939 [Periplaneta americana]|uniref:Uncharacterized protein n=1 Tax=Periplaneta americana TaxID=6978 RepID=A0ABQ8T750_PERAM|nr:hypothetical protein ANN_11939 [Periplaneta americana]
MGIRCGLVDKASARRAENPSSNPGAGENFSPFHYSFIVRCNEMSESPSLKTIQNNRNSALPYDEGWVEWKKIPARKYMSRSEQKWYTMDMELEDEDVDVEVGFRALFSTMDSCSSIQLATLTKQKNDHAQVYAILTYLPLRFGER